MRHTHSEISKWGDILFEGTFLFCTCVIMNYLWNIFHGTKKMFCEKINGYKFQITNKNDLLQFFSPHWLRSSRHFQHTWLLFNFFCQVMQPHLNDTLKRPLTCFLHSFWNMFQPFDFNKESVCTSIHLLFFKGQEISKVNCDVFNSSKNKLKTFWKNWRHKNFFLRYPDL